MIRGFNLDHGTDFRTTVLGMPVNMPSHAHGQGYADLNFLIPELVKSIQYKKGPYYAEDADCSAAGAAAIDYVRALPKDIANLELGTYRYRCALVANSSNLGAGTLLYALEGTRRGGPWKLPGDYKRCNGELSYSWKDRKDDFRITAMAIDSSWAATDQNPRRAIESGTLDRFGFIDPSDGGNTARQSLSADWMRRYADGSLKLNAYLIRSQLDFFSNFTYLLDDPVNGDQFQQSEHRAKLEYAISKDIKLSAEILNLFDRRVNDVEHFYESRLPGEAPGVEDIHLHPVEPRSLRVAIVFGF